MSATSKTSDPAPLKIGSLFSGYGGLDLAVESVFDAETVWFSEINEPVARVFSHHWPDAPNLGDITTIDWSTVPPIDILCGGFPCQDVSTVGKMAGLAPGTRSGLWANMVEAIDALRPGYVVIENVRGLLSASAIRATPVNAPLERDDDATPVNATLRSLEPDVWGLGDKSTRPLRALGAVLGDLADLRYDTQWIGLPASHIGAPHPRFRIFILAHRQALPNSFGLGFLSRGRNIGPSESQTRDNCPLSPDHRFRSPRADRLTRQSERVRDVVVIDRATLQRWGRYSAAISRWEHITGRVPPSPALLSGANMYRPAPEFVEWLMGLERGWVTNPALQLTQNQQVTALGNGVLPLQAVTALGALTQGRVLAL